MQANTPLIKGGSCRDLCGASEAFSGQAVQAHVLSILYIGCELVVSYRQGLLSSSSHLY